MAKKKTTPSIPFEANADLSKKEKPSFPFPDANIAIVMEKFLEQPKAVQNALMNLVEAVEKLSGRDRDNFFELLALFANTDDGFMPFGEDGEDDCEDDENSLFPDEGDYTHFLTRDNVKKYTLRVTLRGTKPAIYRKFIVPSNICLRHLSELLLELMGWENEHLNQFRKGSDFYLPAYQRNDEDDMFSFFGRSRSFNQEDYALSDLLLEKNKTIEWEYDFGDSWQHDVRLSSIGDYAEDEPLVQFVKGERVCPPEDCGGIWGYEELLEINAKYKEGKRLTRDEKERLEWYDMGKGFDAEDFDAEGAVDTCQSFCE